VLDLYGGDSCCCGQTGLLSQSDVGRTPMAYSELYDTRLRRRCVTSFHEVQRRLGIRELLQSLGHARWIREGLRFRIIDCLYGAEYSGPDPFEVDFFGLKYPGSLDSLLDWTVYFFGAYEKENLFFLRDLLVKRSDPVFLDVGANVGIFSLFLSKFAAQVHSFEPWQTVRNALNKKIEMNGITNIAVHPVALGEKNEKLPFYAPRGSNMGTGSFSRCHATDRNRSLGQLDVANGDDYLGSHGISRIDLIKIDVEGWEKHVLLGLRNTLNEIAPIVFLEMSETTLKTFRNLSEFWKCVPSSYQASYVKCGRTGVRYMPFDCRQPGNVLLRVP
jgi:FkbM family methyltransferase